MNRRTYFRLIIIAFGVLVFASTAYHLPFGRIDLRLCLLTLITVAGSSRLAIRIPGIGGRITVSDTLVFLTLLLYGGEAAIVVAAFEGVTSSLRISRRVITVLFNASVMAVSLITGVSIVRLFFGYVIEATPRFTTGRLVGALAVLSLVHYFVNSWLVSIDRSLKTDSPLLATWRQYYLWTSLTYGYSSLSYLARFPINKLKIDRSFIGEMITSDETLEVVRAIVTLAATLRIDVVAEGVETHEQRQILHALNVKYAQGYLFFHPLEASRVEDLLNRARKYTLVENQPLMPLEMPYTEVQSVAVN